ncbi:response regulator [Brevundimonas sp. S30B]|uniref:histidine kinase famiy protein n=1 Tax=unclassified Brevundimonas TaxID=2622653 RepID=UPI0010726702|nr:MULTISPECIES: histidine kinase famiy protein [unclassified Brevundimonas]QBX37682.1 response regulator [Brevundimonas sp. MF30-B]TFW03523.1 response regulator [Brevundimonas sp. S30B]
MKNSPEKPPVGHPHHPMVTAEGFGGTDDIFFAAVEMTRMPMIVTDPNLPDNPIVFANAAFVEMSGYSHAEILGRNCRFLQGAGTDRDTVSQVRQAIEDRTDIAVEILNYKRDGSAFWNALFVSPVFAPDGRLVYFFASQLDVTRRRDAEDALRQAQKMEAVGQLTGGIAHDFNNMLTVIMGNVESALEKSEDETIRRRLERALEGARRAETLTSQLLAFARKQRLDGRPTNLNALAEATRAMAGRTLGSHVSIRLDLDQDLRLARIDAVQAETALLNILINARDALPETGGSVVVATRNLTLTDEGHPSGAAAGDYVVMSVSDDGEGMTPDVLQRVTEPFFTTKEVGRGTGMGLAMVYGFMRQSQGQLHLESTPGVGTTVSLLFPAVSGDAAYPERAPMREVKGGDETILMVEDNLDVMEMGRSILNDFGYEVVSAGTARDALAMIDAGRSFDLLFTDIVMPGGMNGVTLAHEVRRRRPHAKVLLTTGWADRALDDVEDRGGFDLIGKPYRRADLARKVRLLLDGPDGVS